MVRPRRLSPPLWLAALASALCVGAASGAALRPGPGETSEPPTPQLLNPRQTDVITFDPRVVPPTGRSGTPLAVRR